jgi:hypothetical protein
MQPLSNSSVFPAPLAMLRREEKPEKVIWIYIDEFVVVYSLWF